MKRNQASETLNMSFLSKLKKTITASGESPPSPKELADLRSERRYHQRLSFHGRQDVSVAIGSTSLRIIDVSYGGLAVAIDEAEIQKMTLAGILQAEISAIDIRVPCAFEQVRIIRQSSGETHLALRFDHTVVSSLRGLREIIEPMNSGKSLKEIASTLLKTEKSHDGWRYFRADGPIDFSFRSEGPNSLLEGILTFPRGEQYAELRLSGGELSVSLTQKGNDHRAGQTVNAIVAPDLADLRQGLLILMGAREKIGTEIVPFLEKMSQAIAKQISSSAK